ncbi:hypothetical protein AERO9AM_30626 [Aeromicrobium sp. 9AM]|nr:hypothetical protein AERO9AM_30626 [Aeromicrobium sp. 9AM]
MQPPGSMTDAEITHRLDTIGAQFHVASAERRAVLHTVVDDLLDEQARRRSLVDHG